MSSVAVKVLVVLSYTPRAVNCNTGFVGDTREPYSVKKLAKLLYTCNDVLAVVAVSVMVEVTGLPTEYCGPNGEGWVVDVVGVGVTGSKEVGTNVKLVGNVVKSNVCGPIATTAEINAAFVLSRVKPVASTVTKGVAAPAAKLYRTRKLAGWHTWLPRPQDSVPGADKVPPATWTDACELTAVAVKSGGADPKAVTSPLRNTGEVAVKSDGRAREPVLTTKADATGSAAALVPFPANV